MRRQPVHLYGEVNQAARLCLRFLTADDLRSQGDPITYGVCALPIWLWPLQDPARLAVGVAWQRLPMRDRPRRQDDRTRMMSVRSAGLRAERVERPGLILRQLSGGLPRLGARSPVVDWR